MVRCALLLAASVLYAAPPQILKVEPPNWWARHSLKTVRVLIRGSNLAGVRAESALRPGRVSWNTAGTYAFIDLTIPSGIRAGSYALKLTNSDGAASVPFEITPRLDRKGHFQGFSSNDVIYLIMPDRFSNGDASNDGSVDRSDPRRYHGGDLQGIVERLPYLRDLGVTALWINPVYDNAGSDYHGYGAIDFYSVDEHLGDLSTFRKLVDAAHEHGIKVIQDQVVNHTGPLHPWVADPPTPTWFNGSAANHIPNDFRIWTTLDPYASPRTQRRTLAGWFLNILPDLNQEDAEVRRYLVQNTLWWIEMSGIDGIRQDTLPYVPHDFWSEWMFAIRREYAHFQVVGEVLNSDPVLVSSFQSAVDTLFDFPLYYAIRKVFAEGSSISELPATLAHDRLYQRPERLVTLLGLHDVPRFLSAPGATMDGLKLAFTFLLTTRGTPLIYYGDEIGMEGGGDPDNRRDFPGGWSGDRRNAFVRSDRTAEENSVFDHVRRLLHLRAKSDDLRRGALRNLLVTERQYIYSRGQTIIALNTDVKTAVPEFELNTNTSTDDELGSSARLQSSGGVARIQLPARSAAIFSLKRAL